MTYIKDFTIRGADSASLDAFGRWRTSNPSTVIESKQSFSAQPLLWDDQEVSGSGTSSTHSANYARSRLSVSATTAGRRVRQTFQRCRYQPGKSQEIMLTFVLDAAGGGTGITRLVGYGDDNNGIFLKDNAGTYQVVRRTNVTGTPADNAVSQASWNLDPMDGSGTSGITLDFTKTQILFIDFEWLGVGRVRIGFVVDGKVYYAHEFKNANSLSEVYMSTPNLPLRFEIQNNGTGAVSSLDAICGAVMSEGGQEPTGLSQYHSTGGTHVDANAADTVYAVVGIRLKSAFIGVEVVVMQVSVISETNDDFEWLLIHNPTVAGTFTYSDKTNSAMQTASGATANTVTGGTTVAGGFAKSSGSLATEVQNLLRLGASIAGTVDELVLCVRPLSANADIQGSLTWQERS